MGCILIDANEEVGEDKEYKEMEDKRRTKLQVGESDKENEVSSI